MKRARAVAFVVALMALGSAVGLLLWAWRDIAQAAEFVHDAQDPLPRRAMLAVAAVEDPRFPERMRVHTAANLERAVVAACSRWRMCGPTAAASLTEQLIGWQIKGRPISRLSRLLITSIVIDLRFEDEEIITAYCNSVYFGRTNGSSLHGLRQASAAYFGKAPEQLTVAQLAALVASIRSPAVFSPAVRSDRAAARRRAVLRTLVRSAVATPAEVVAAERELSAHGI
jgi:membrane peptidoglycan carboxypeptidase